MKKTMHIAAIIVVLSISMIIAWAAEVSAAGDIGSVVALRGSAVIESDSGSRDAKVKDGIQLRDTVETRMKSRTKMLFIDDSVLTLGENARVVIKEFVYAKDKEGKSIFNLIDGKMRSVVGRAGFEVHTATAVAAARGTVFDCETGIKGGKAFTTCTSYEGLVDITSIDPTIKGHVTLRPGMTVTVIGGEPLSAPTPVSATNLQQGGAASAAAGGSLPFIQAPPIVQQPLTRTSTTPVNVVVGFPATNNTSNTSPVNIGIIFP